jgi:SAM-dependent methyltransferase
MCLKRVKKKHLSHELLEKYKDEIDWWTNILIPENRHEWMQDAINPENRIKNQPPKLLDFIKELGLKRVLRVLDVGSGLLSPLAWFVDQKLIEVTAIDPLAEIYGEILHQYRIDYPIRPVHGKGEEITEMFRREQFDIVYTRNAIDHSDSPPTCVENMVTVLKQGGILYMAGYQNEGNRANYWGLHHWNLSFDENNDLICFGKSGQRVNVTRNLPLKCIYTYGPDDKDWYVIAYKRNFDSGKLQIS